MKKYGYITDMVETVRDGLFYTTYNLVPVERRVEIVGSNDTHYVVRPVNTITNSAQDVKRVIKSNVILEKDS